MDPLPNSLSFSKSLNIYAYKFTTHTKVIHLLGILLGIPFAAIRCVDNCIRTVFEFNRPVHLMAADGIPHLINYGSLTGELLLYYVIYQHIVRSLVIMGIFVHSTLGLFM